MRGRLVRIVARALLASIVLSAVPASAAAGQDPSNTPGRDRNSQQSQEDRGAVEAGATPASPGTVGVVARFLAGGATGLALHESGHLATAYLFNGHPGVKRVRFGPIPFFAITHRGDLSPRREFVVSSAGFWVQQLGNEVLLSRRPELRSSRAPALKGLFAFNVLASAAYAANSFARRGPPERDTRSMSAFLGGNEAVVGALLLGPAALDTVRYYRPHAAWAVWASRAAKAAMVVVVVRKGRGGR